MAAVSDYARVVASTADDYRSAALERMGDADVLRRLERYPFAMYAAGVAVECMLRAFRHQDLEHQAHRDDVSWRAGVAHQLRIRSTDHVLERVRT